MQGYFCICCGKPWSAGNEWDDEHHRQPKSQNGTDDPQNKVRVCRECHEKYHNICGQRLAARVEDRVTNFRHWASQFKGVTFFGFRGGIRPADMAPDFVHDEVGYFILTGISLDYSDGCLSRIGRVSEYPVREHLRKAT